ncbi:hypothetical protein Slala03_70000 [Streptomyces lavendulae subsp. lavendulae]|nr:hypothetical protein Slala03_70000 [Streptomyces lavendulae subsp. lavendulae]
MAGTAVMRWGGRGIAPGDGTGKGRGAVLRPGCRRRGRPGKGYGRGPDEVGREGRREALAVAVRGAAADRGGLAADGGPGAGAHPVRTGRTRGGSGLRQALLRDA